MQTYKLKTLFPLFLVLFIVLIFISLANEVVEKETYWLDLGVNNWAIGLRSPILTQFMKVITDFGMIGGVFIIGFISAYLLIHKKIHVLYGLLVSSISAGLFTYFLKLVIVRSRPELVNRLVTESGFSFPSGHATTAFVASPILAIMVYYSTHIPVYLKYILICVLAIFPFVVSFSRLYLGVHYFSDVVAGAIVGLSATCVFYYFHSKYDYD